jgi:hypothetical protein
MSSIEQATIDLMFNVVSDLRSVLNADCHMPNTPHEMYDPQFFVKSFCDTVTLRLHMLIRNGADPDCNYIKAVLQNAVKTKEYAGFGVDNTIYIEDVRVEGLFLAFYVHLLTPKSYKALRKQFNANKQQQDTGIEVGRIKLPDTPKGYIVVGFSKKHLDEGIMTPIYWKPERHAMMLVVGGTGVGKSILLRFLMCSIGATQENASYKNIAYHSQVFLCDFKNIDFKEFADCPRRWSYDDCAEGLNTFYESCMARINGTDTTTNRRFLVFDEWATFILSREKKEGEELKRKLSTLLMCGRGVSHFVIIGLQRADAQLFPLGGRDQFSAIFALGNLSDTQKTMLFPDIRESMTEVMNQKGCGYLHMDGDETLKQVQLPYFTDRMLTDMDFNIRGVLTQ